MPTVIRTPGPVMLVLLMALALSASAVRAQEPDSAADATPLSRALSSAERADIPAMTIYNRDVFKYFRLDDEYDTDLKKAVFKKTAEYQTLLDSMKVLRAKLLAGWWFVDVQDQPYGGWADEAWGELTNYDMDSHGMRLVIGMNMGSGTAAARAPKSYGSFLFSSLPTKRVAGDPEFFPDDVKEERLFLPMSEENGLAVETGKSDIKVYVLFSVTGTEEVSFHYRCVTYGPYTITQKLLTSENVRVIVANVKTGDVYFNKSY